MNAVILLVMMYPNVCAGRYSVTLSPYLDTHFVTFHIFVRVWFLAAGVFVDSQLEAGVRDDKRRRECNVLPPMEAK